jgi:hypothetical protein
VRQKRGDRIAMKFILAARRKREDTQERYFHEWGVIHVALMITNPSTHRAFTRYAQHYTINDVDEDLLWFRRSAMAWDNMSDHWLNGMEELKLAVSGSDYQARMQPHKFGGDEFCVELTDGRELYEAPGFQSGGVKLIHFLRKLPQYTETQFDARMRDEHAPRLLEALRPLGILRKYVQNPRLPLDPALFKGSLFEKGGMGNHAMIEEFWFPGLEELQRLRASPAWSAIGASYAALTAAGSFSMVTTERVVFDYVTAGRQTPKPAVLTPGTLEWMIDQQGYAGFNIPKPPGAPPASR